MLKNTLGWMTAALVCGGCSQAGMVVGTAPAELAMPEQIDVVFNHNPRSRYRSALTGEWRNGDDMEAWLIEAINGDSEEVLVAVQKHQFTIESLQRLLKAENLEFCDFTVPEAIKMA